MLFKKSWNLFYSNIVGRPVRLACVSILKHEIAFLSFLRLVTFTVLATFNNFIITLLSINSLPQHEKIYQLFTFEDPGPETLFGGLTTLDPIEEVWNPRPKTLGGTHVLTKSIGRQISSLDFVFKNTRKDFTHLYNKRHSQQILFDNSATFFFYQSLLFLDNF